MEKHRNLSAKKKIFDEKISFGENFAKVRRKRSFKKVKFWAKIENFGPNGNFDSKSKVWINIEILVRKKIFGTKKFW